MNVLFYYNYLILFYGDWAGSLRPDGRRRDCRPALAPQHR